MSWLRAVYLREGRYTMDETLTQKQREAVEALEGARRTGVCVANSEFVP